MSRGRTFCAVAWLVAAAAARAADAPAADTDAVQAVPYRPSVSAPAALSAPGWVEVEAGYAHERDGDARRQSLPWTLKLVFTPDWGVRIGGDAWVRQRAPGMAARSGVGDTGVVVKRRFAVDEQQAFGLEAAVVVPTARDGLHAGSGKPDHGLAAIWSADLGAWHVDANVAATRLGAREPGTRRVEWLYAFAVSHPLYERLGAVAELSGTERGGAGSTRQALAALSYAVTPRLVIDAGAARSLKGGPVAWQAFAGFTWTAWQLF